MIIKALADPPLWLNIFVGLIGLTALAFFGIICWLGFMFVKENKKELDNLPYPLRPQIATKEEMKHIAKD